MKIALSAESTVDFQSDLIKKYDLNITPFTILLGDKCAEDGDITTQEIIEFVNKNNVLPKTSAVNESQYDEFFAKLLKDNDAIIHFTISSEISSAYNNAVNSSKKFKNVYIVDSRSLSTGIGLQVIYARKLIDKGLDIQEIYEKCQKRVPSVQASFILKRLDYLYKGGRCSSLALLGANILKIRPQIIVKDGKMISGKKYRGEYEHNVISYVNDTLEQFNNPDLEEVFITYTTANPDTVAKVKEILSERGFKNIHETNANATITSHCGENTIGILYINDGGVE